LSVESYTQEEAAAFKKKKKKKTLNSSGEIANGQLALNFYS
jgi:hypothetical protein